VVDSQDVPSRDALDHLFGDSSSGFSAPQPQSRREAREAEALTARRSRSRRTAPPVVRPLDSAYPANRVIVVRQAPKKSAKKRGSGFLTILAVLGLFGSVALPAYAMAPQAEADSTATEAKDTSASLLVSDDVFVAAATRGEFSATTATDLRAQKRNAMMAANYEAYLASGAREKGDDYPWFSELSNNQGGGLSPLNYFYRECVDFVAWRLNRDAGSVKAPFLYDWSTLTPTGGNAYQWRYAWIKKGWETSTTPVAGAVAWYSYGHIGYVKSINADGTITVEDYNQSGMHQYDIRTVAANDAQLYLYPPPR
jgi:surface antigen